MNGFTPELRTVPVAQLIAQLAGAYVVVESSIGTLRSMSGALPRRKQTVRGFVGDLE